jgi:hypothetical protein
VQKAKSAEDDPALFLANFYGKSLPQRQLVVKKYEKRERRDELRREYDLSKLKGGGGK